MDIASMDLLTLTASITVFWLAIFFLLVYVIKEAKDVDRRIKHLTRNEGT